MGEGLYYPCSEKKDADQLRGYREADLRLCFRICKNPVFSRRGSYNSSVFVMIASNLFTMQLQANFDVSNLLIPKTPPVLK